MPMRHVWIFQLATSPDSGQSATLTSGLDHLMQTWKAHGSPVPGTYQIRYDRFLIVQAEPGHASGCSIDSMNRSVAELLSNAQLQVLGADRVLYRGADGGIQDIDFKEVRAAIQDGRLHADTTVFDSTLSNSNDLSKWEVPLSQTWMARFLPVKA